ncbi:MAG TPA: phage terminase large subunit family protein, partial [Thermoleophilaceae bacterium]|nr:phage terminase large subunit family protein [Thermoleophilaceae bacterium]
MALVEVAPALTEAVPDWCLALTPPPALTISQWADTYRRISAEDSAEPGGWRTSRTEYLRGIMDACCDPRVREVIIVKAAQLGGTQLLLTIAGSSIHWRHAHPIRCRREGRRRPS